MGMLCPRLPEEGDAGWSTQGCALEVFWHPQHPSCCQVTPVWEASPELPFPASPMWMMCKTQLLCSFPGKTGHENKAQPCWAGSGSPHGWVGADRASSSLSGMRAPRDPLGISSAGAKHPNTEALQGHLPRQVWPQLSGKQEERQDGREGLSLRAAAKLPPAGESSK